MAAPSRACRDDRRWDRPVDPTTSDDITASAAGTTTDDHPVDPLAVPGPPGRS